MDRTKELNKECFYLIMNCALSDNPKTRIQITRNLKKRLDEYDSIIKNRNKTIEDLITKLAKAGQTIIKQKGNKNERRKCLRRKKSNS